MRLAVIGILSDYRGRVFLRQKDARTLEPVGAPLEPGTPPADTLARIYREETGLIVLPVRLTGIYYDAGTPSGELTICYRCTMRGGEVMPSTGGFFDCTPLPDGLSARSRRAVDDALRHPGGPPYLARTPGGLGAWLGRRLGGRDDMPGPDWDVMVKVWGGWARAVSDESQRLPADRPTPDEAPWETAARLLRDIWPKGDERATLTAVSLAAGRPAMTWLFTVGEERGKRLGDWGIERLAAEDAALVKQAGRVDPFFVEEASSDFAD